MTMDSDRPPADFTGLWVRNDPFGGRREIEMVNGIGNGRFRSYLPNGAVQREGRLADGLLNSDLITRNDQGEVLHVSHFDHGTGIYRIFFSNGRLACEMSLVRGEKHGITRRFSSCGECWQIEEHDHGKLVASFDPTT